jgi:zinc transporter, ZIP family
MAMSEIAVLGAVAGFTIFLGLPVGRLRNPAPRLRAILNAGAVGILLFLFWDVLAQAWEPIDEALAGHHYAEATVSGVVLAAGLGVGLLGLVYFDGWVAARRPAKQPSAAVMPVAAGLPGKEPGRPAEPVTRTDVSAERLSFLIAVGIGLHNFAEGLAIGNSAARGEIALAVLLVVGFGLHNATEGFGIVAPLAAAGIRPSWSRLAVLGLIAGGPTFVGTVVGQGFTNELVSVAFLTLAAGSILYVIIELLVVSRRMAAKPLITWGLLAGLLLGFATDAVITAAGA